MTLTSGIKQSGWVWGFVVGSLTTLCVSVAMEYIRPRLSRPDIGVEFEAKPPYMIQTPITPVGRDIRREYYPAYVFRFGIRNRSGYHVARNCVVMLTGFWHVVGEELKQEQNFEPVRLDWYPYMPRDLSGDMAVFAPFGRIAHPIFQMKYERGLYSGDPRKPQFRFLVPNYPRWMSSHVLPGKHLFRIAVYFDNRPAVEQEFEIDWSGKWSDDYAGMLKNIVIRKRS